MPERTKVTIELNAAGVAQVRQAMAAATTAVRQLGAGVGGTTTQFGGLRTAAEGATSRIGTMMSRLAALAAGFIGVRAAIHQMTAALQEASELQRLANMTGMTAHEIAVLREQMDDLGLDTSRSDMVIMRMSRAIGEAATDGGQARDAFERLGLSVEKLLNLSPVQQFNAIRNALAAMPDPANRAARAMEIFSYEGLRLMPLFAKAASEEYRLVNGIEAMARAAPVALQLSVALQQVKGHMQGFFGGIIEAVGPALTKLLNQLLELPVGEWGRTAGALVLVMKNAIQEGRFSEFLGLVIEAGFEQGAEVGSRILKKVLGDANIWTALGAGAVRVWESIGRSWVEIGLKPWPYVLAAINWVIDSAVSAAARAWDKVKEYGRHAINAMMELAAEGLRSVANAMGRAIEWVLNQGISGLNALLGLLQKTPFAKVIGGPIELPKIELGEVKPIKVPLIGEFEPAQRQPAMTFAEHLAGARGYIRDETERIKNEISEGANALVEKLGGKPVDHSVTATKRLVTEIEKVKRELDELNAKREAEQQVTRTVSKTVNVEIELRKLETAQKSKLVEIEQQLAQVSGNWRMTEREKWVEQRNLLEQQRQSLKEYVLQLDELRNKQGISTVERLRVEEAIVQAQSNLARTESAMLQLGPNLDSYSDQFTRMLVELQNAWGSWGSQLANSFKAVFENAIQSISGGITGLIMGTKRWGEALREIGVSILTSIVSAIVQMGVRWVATQIMIAMFGKAIAASALAASAPIATASSAMWATPAYLASVATLGGAAATGGAALTAGQAAATAQSVAATAVGFQTGGFTGYGPETEPAGVVHRGEYVLDAETVRRYGLEEIKAIHAGTAEIVKNEEFTRTNLLKATTLDRVPAAHAATVPPVGAVTHAATVANAPTVTNAALLPHVPSVTHAAYAAHVTTVPVSTGVGSRGFESHPPPRWLVKTPTVSHSALSVLGNIGTPGMPQKTSGEPSGAVSASFTQLVSFRSAGFTGTGAANEPAGIVHRGEFVIDAKTVRRVGVPALNSLKRGTGEIALKIPGYAKGGLVGASERATAGLDALKVKTPENISVLGGGEPGGIALQPANPAMVRVDVGPMPTGWLRDTLVAALSETQQRTTRNEVQVAVYNDKAAALEALRTSRGRRFLIDLLRGQTIEL